MPIQHVSMIARPSQYIPTNPDQEARSAVGQVTQACGDLLTSPTIRPEEYQHSGSQRCEKSNGSLIERLAVGIGRANHFLEREAVGPPAGSGETDLTSVIAPDGLVGATVDITVGE